MQQYHLLDQSTGTTHPPHHNPTAAVESELIRGSNTLRWVAVWCQHTHFTQGFLQHSCRDVPQQVPEVSTSHNVLQDGSARVLQAIANVDQLHQATYSVAELHNCPLALSQMCPFLARLPPEARPARIPLKWMLGFSWTSWFSKLVQELSGMLR